MRITILHYLDREGSKKHDVVVDQIQATLKSKGHDVSILGAHGDVSKLIAGLKRRKPDLVFNVMEMFGRNILGDVAVVGLLDLLNIHYTGGGPGELFLQQDKVLTKKLLAYHNIRSPDFAVFSPMADMETGGNLRMPLFVKPLRCDASIGIDGKSLVHNATEMMKRVEFIHTKLRDSALAEEFISGREFFVGLIGNTELIAFPAIEVDYSGMPEGKPNILDSKAKWDKNSVEFKGTKSILAEIPDELQAKLRNVAQDAYHALKVRDYGRIDLRLTDSGDIYVIEVNANCYLERESEFAMAAEAGGLDYPALIENILELAKQRASLPSLVG